MKIKEFRLSKKMTQEELADAVQVGRTAVTMWENGAANPPASKIPLIASVLGCKIEDLFDGDKMAKQEG